MKKLFKDMRTSTGIFLVMIAIAIIGVAVANVANKKSGTTNTIVEDSGMFCSSDGILTNSKPIQSHRSYCLKTGSGEKTYGVNSSNQYSFSMVDDQGKTLKNFEITHTKPMHVIVVRKDLANFQHLHPEFDSTSGMFTLNDLKLPTDGIYTVFADFAPQGGQIDSSGIPLPVILSEDITVGNTNNYTPQSIGASELNKTFDGYKVGLTTDQTLVSGKEAILTFDIKQNGKPVTDLQEYLGDLGHNVILREGNLDFIHAHPMEDISVQQNGKVSFMVTFPEAGKYKVFTQFQRSGKVFTTDFVVSVAQGANFSMDGTMDMNMPSMNH